MTETVDPGDARRMANRGDHAYYYAGDLVMAESWWKKAADLSNSDGMTGLGWLAKETGDLVLAESWFQKAADLGNPTGMYSLGWLAYEAGDLELARSWYQKAADFGYQHAIDELAKLDAS